MKHDDQFSVFWVKFTTLAHKIEALFNNIFKQLLDLFVCQLWRKLPNWLAEAHLITDHDYQDLDKLSWFYKQLNWSYHDMASDISQHERHCQWTTQKAFIPPAASPCVAKLSEPSWHAAVPTCPDGYWRCGEPGHFSKDCTKPQTNKPAQIKKIESWLDDQLSCQDFKTQYFSSNDDDDFSENNLNILKNLYVS